MGFKQWLVWVSTQWSRWALGRMAVYFLLGVWVIQANPFGLSAASDRALSEELSRIRAYLFPVAPAPITVVEIDYESIKSLHGAAEGWMGANDWPLSYQDHARILRDLASPDGVAPPATLFYDIFFERPRNMSGDLGRLGRTLSSLTRSKEAVPIHVSGGGEPIPMEATAYRAMREPALAVVAWEAGSGVYPLHARLRPADASTAVPERAPLAATALFLDLCRERGLSCDWALSDEAPSMALQWEVQDKPECSMSTTTDRWTRAVSGVKSIIWRALGLSSAVDHVSAACLPYHRIRLADFYEDRTRLKPPHSDEPYAVLVGVAMESLHDYHDSPVYGRIAGVHVHAMALENLIRLDEGYIRDQDLRPLSIITWLVVLTAFWLQRHRQRRTKPRPRRMRSFLKKFEFRAVGPRSWVALWLFRKARWIVFFSIVVLAMHYVLYVEADIAPEGWLSLIALVPILREIVAGTENRFDMEKEKKE